MGTLSGEVGVAVAALRQGPPQVGARQPWSLDNVVRLHNELRAEAPSPAAGRGALALAEAVDSEPVDAVPRAAELARGPLSAPIDAESPRRSRRTWWIAAAIVGTVGAFGFYLQAQVRAGLQEAAARAAAAERGAEDARARAAREIALAQQTADLRLRQAQQAAQSAQMVAMIAASGDLRRFDLAAPGGAGSAQVLWSRSQGLALTAIGVPAAPAGQTYQVWLMTPTGATSVGLMPVDDEGRASLVVTPPASLPRPIVRAAVTLEPADGSEAPTGPVALAMPPAVRSAPVP